MRNIYFLIFLLNSILITSTVRYVNRNSTGSISPYTSWSTAGTDLQAVINVSQAGDEIWVASGTYIPARDAFGNASPSDGRHRTFYLKDGISVYGGFNGTETSLASRNFNTNITILSGDLGTPGSINDNSYHVVLFSGSSTSAMGVKLDGFSITGGFATETSSIQVNGNAVSGLAGPAIRLLYGNNIISNNKIYVNRGYSGGAIYASNGNNIISDNEIYNNIANYDGGGVSVYRGTNTITRNYIHDNTATGDGGGIYSQEGVNNVISKNIIGKNKGGISMIDTYYYGGGGIYAEKGSNTIINNVFYENTSNYMGGAILLYYGNNKVINNTIYKNNATKGGGFYTYLGTNTVKNNILWANINSTNSEPGADFRNDHDWPATNYIFNNMLQLPQNLYNTANDNSLSGNINNNIFQASPGFKNETSIFGTDGILRTSDDGLSISSNSSAIDAGHVTDAPADDITGMVRIGNPDIGAYELTGNLSTTEIKKENAGMYPNPAENVLHIMTHDKILKLEFLNASGQLVKTAGKSEVDISALPAGIYMVRIITENNVVTEKLIKK